MTDRQEERVEAERESKRESGKVWLVGAGPGDVGLLTLRGAEVLEQAETVVYDQLVGGGILMRMPEEAEWIDAGKHAGNHRMEQEDINRLLIEKAKEGKRVVRLKGGDPFLFGRGGEEAEALREAKVPFEVVPGVSSVAAVPAYAGIPVTHRDYTPSVHIISAHRKKGSKEGVDYQALAALGDVTLVFFMGVRLLPEITEGLMAAGVEATRAAAVIERGSRWNQRVVTAPLAELAKKAKQEGIGTPALIVVGRVCELASVLSWAADRPLWGRRVWLVRPRGKESALAKKLESLGAEVLQVPSGKIEPVANTEEICCVMEELTLQSYAWLAFTSAAGVESFFEAFLEAGGDSRKLAGIKIASVGAATSKALRERGLLADCEPKTAYGAELAKAMLEQMDKKKRVLLCVPAGVESDCAEVLRASGVEVKELPLYQIKEAEPKWCGLAELQLQKEDFVLFASASAVRSFTKAMRATGNLEKGRAICIGKKTQQEAVACGWSAVCSKKVSLDSMVEKLLEESCEGQKRKIE